MFRVCFFVVAFFRLKWRLCLSIFVVEFRPLGRFRTFRVWSACPVQREKHQYQRLSPFEESEAFESYRLQTVNSHNNYSCKECTKWPLATKSFAESNTNVRQFPTFATTVTSSMWNYWDLRILRRRLWEQKEISTVFIVLYSRRGCVPMKVLYWGGSSPRSNLSRFCIPFLTGKVLICVHRPLKNGTPLRYIFN